jgi:hypothetical protein
MGQATCETAVVAPVVEKDRRAERRVKISRLTLVRPSDPKYKEQVHTTLNASRDGLYFTTGAKHYYIGMRLRVTSGYAPNDPCNSVSFGEVVRIERLKDSRFGIAVRILVD